MITFSFILLIGLSSSILLVQLPTFSANIVGVSEASVYGIRVVGYVFNSHGEGLPSKIIIQYYKHEYTFTTFNGSFNIFLNVTYIDGSTIKLNIEPIIFSPIFSYQFTLVPNHFITFSHVSSAIEGINTQTLSMISVKGKTFIAADPNLYQYLVSNGKYVSLNYYLLEVNSDNVSLPYEAPLIYYGNSLILQSLSPHLTVLLVTIFALIDVFNYFELSVFPRGELKGIIRFVGIERIYFSKLLAGLILTLILSTISFITFLEISGILEMSILVKYLIDSLAFYLGTFGLSPFGSKNMIYSSVTLGIYIIGLTYYVNYAYVLLTSLLIIIGYLKLKYNIFS
ncbi:hypothetical protein DJ524_01435 [Sulfolobus sp. D5]|nr:hypothetical protein DJ523_01145 [Sulfolobus sp. E5]TRM82192.1 hypothetical protein DJ524_01435 [Sulfolobus sp. D5]TRM84321.1 hypothetical protein DJ522_05125 [Sulfolobus sp. F3]